MFPLIKKTFIKNYKQLQRPEVRYAYGKTAGAIGIVTNLLLFAAKIIVGILSGSITIVADAINNLSDAGSSIITLLGFKISAKPADRNHPFGYARIEYVASMIVSFLILFVSVSLFSESIQKILNPTETDYSIVVMIILAVSVLGKLWLFLFGRSAGKRLNSGVIRASATDSLSDAGATFAVLISAIIATYTGVNIDGYMGVAVSIIIFIAGIKVLNETKNSILGSAPEPEVVEGIHNIVKEYPQILGVHDMVVHNYGPGNTICSFHAEVDGKVNVFETHDCIDNVEKQLYHDLGIRATIHMDPIVTDDEKVSVLRAKTAVVVKEIDIRMNIHDFRYVEGITHSNLIFDVTVPFEIKESNERIKELVSNKIAEIDPNYFAVITIDRE